MTRRAPYACNMGGDKAKGGLRGALRRMTLDESELDAAELRDDVDEMGATPLSNCADRERVTIGGQIKSVTLTPVGGVPALEAEVFDGDNSVTLLFLGRRSVGGIEPGRVVVAEGRLSRNDGRNVIVNPRYDLMPAGR
jgi:hypothetical protein